MLGRVLRIIIRWLQRLNEWYSNLSLSYNIKTSKVKIAKIEEGDNLGEKVLVFKEKTNERVELQNIYRFSYNGSYEVECPEVDVWLFKNVINIADADYVVFQDDRVFWQKYHAYNYSKNIVRDYGIVKEENGTLYYYNPKVVHKVDNAFSLIGVFAHIWSHSLSEHYIKLSVLGDIVKLSEKRLTVLVPEYTDNQLRLIVYKEINKYDVDVLEVKKGEAVLVNHLYYMERPAFFTDHENAVAVGDNIQPKIIADTLKKQLVEPFVKGLKTTEHIKLYLPRRGSYRTLINNNEVEEFFKSQGYYFLEPHKVSLDEKIKIFRSADIIVGPYSSAFSNLLFCKPGTKVLILSNYNRAFESWLVMHKQHFHLDMLWVTGYDDKKADNPAHCNFRIPLHKIIDAAKALGIINEYR